MEDGKIRVLLIEDNIVSARLEEGMLAHADAKRFQVQRADTLLAALDQLAKLEFDIAILDLTLPDSHGVETFLTVQRHAPALPVIVVTGIDDESVALNAVRQGAQDYLVKGDLNQEKLIRALNYALARTRKPQERQVQPENKASMVGFLGSKGGVGTTTLACHWALELSKLGGKVLVVDLDMSSGATSFLMKAESRYTLLDAALNLHRLDRELWNGMACHVQDGVDLIQAPGATAISDAVTAERVRHVLRFAQMQYRWIVIDLGRLNPSSFTILDDSPELFVVTNGELPALHETGRVLRRVLGAGFSPEKLKLLLNRRMKSVSVPGDAIEKALGYPVYASIDDFGAELSEAYAEGQFLGEKLKLRKSVARIVRRWQGVEEKTASNSVFGLLGLRSNGVGAQRAR
jgi:Flp pilus assembly CpaE family ATPase